MFCWELLDAIPLLLLLIADTCYAVPRFAMHTQGATSPPKHTPTVEEGRMWRGSQYWLAGAAAAVGAYVVLGGHYFAIQTVEDGEVEEVEEVDEDEEDE